MREHENHTHRNKSFCQSLLRQHMRELNLDIRHRFCKKRAASVIYLKFLMLQRAGRVKLNCMFMNTILVEKINLLLLINFAV